jgi:hypothetical protein
MTQTATNLFDWNAAAVVVAFVALALALWEGFQNRRHNRLSVSPNIILNLDIHFGGQPTIVVLRNAGLGPAQITEMLIATDGEPLKGVNSREFISVLRSVCGGDDLYVGAPPSVMQSGESFSLVSYDNGDRAVSGGRKLRTSGGRKLHTRRPLKRARIDRSPSFKVAPPRGRRPCTEGKSECCCESTWRRV